MLETGAVKVPERVVPVDVQPLTRSRSPRREARDRSPAKRRQQTSKRRSRSVSRNVVRPELKLTRREPVRSGKRRERRDDRDSSTSSGTLRRKREKTYFSSDTEDEAKTLEILKRERKVAKNKRDYARDKVTNLDNMIKEFQPRPSKTKHVSEGGLYEQVEMEVPRATLTPREGGRREGVVLRSADERKLDRRGRGAVYQARPAIVVKVEINVNKDEGDEGLDKLAEKFKDITLKRCEKRVRHRGARSTGGAPEFVDDVRTGDDYREQDRTRLCRNPAQPGSRWCRVHNFQYLRHPPQVAGSTHEAEI
jgi:hypothetical protein